MGKILLMLFCLSLPANNLFAGKLLDQAIGDENVYTKQDYKASPKTDFHAKQPPQNGTKGGGSQPNPSSRSLSTDMKQNDMNSGLGDYRSGSRSF